MLLGALASGVDEAFLAWSVRPAQPRLTLHSSLRSLAIAEQRTQSDIAEDALFDPAPVSVRVQAIGSKRDSGVHTQLATCELPEPTIAHRWGLSGVPRELSIPLYLRAAPRPLIILMSGWSPTSYLGPALAWPLQRLAAAGFDVAVPLLPWAPKPRDGTNSFPSSDPCWNIVTVAVVTLGLAQLVRYARNRGHPTVIVAATSLGAYLAATFATRPEAALIDHMVLEKPLGQLSDLVRWHARGDPVWCQHVADRLQRVYRSVCPLDRAPKLTAERVTVIGAEFDRVTPLSAAQQVADHFQVPLRQIKASHLFDPGRATRLLKLLTELRVRKADCE